MWQLKLCSIKYMCGENTDRKKPGTLPKSNGPHYPIRVIYREVGNQWHTFTNREKPLICVLPGHASGWRLDLQSADGGEAGRHATLAWGRSPLWASTRSMGSAFCASCGAGQRLTQTRMPPRGWRVSADSQSRGLRGRSEPSCGAAPARTTTPSRCCATRSSLPEKHNRSIYEIRYFTTAAAVFKYRKRFTHRPALEPGHLNFKTSLFVTCLCGPIHSVDMQ